MQVHSFQFFLSVIVSNRILSLATCLSEQLQCIKLDMAKAAELVSATVDTLQVLSSNDNWEHLYKYVQDIAKLHNVSIEPSRSRRLPARLEGVIMETTGARDTMNASDANKYSFYFTVLDAILSEFHHRITKKTGINEIN